MSPRPTARRCALLVLLALFALSATVPFTSTTSAAVRTLNPVGTAVSAFAVSPSDQRAVFLASVAASIPDELYSTPIAGGLPLKLNAPLAPASSITNLRVSPTGGRAAYIGQHVGDTPDTLYSVPTAGGAPVELASTQSLGAAIEPFTLQFTPDGSQLLFRVNVRQFGPLPLYRAQAVGGTAQKIDDNVISFTVTPDSKTVIYTVEAFPTQLKSAPLDGSTTPIILGALPENSAFAISSNSALVVYTSAGPFGEPVSLVSQPVGGGDQTTLYSIGGANPQVDRVAITPANDRVLYTTRSTDARTTISLFSVPIVGGPSTPLAQAISPIGGTASMALFPSPGNRVIYLSTVFPSPFSSSGTGELWSVPLTGGEPSLLLNLGAATLSPEVVFSVDGASIAFGTTAGVYAGATSAGPPAQLSDQQVSAGPTLSTDGRAVFIAGGKLRAATLNADRNDEVETLTDVTPTRFMLLGGAVVYSGQQGSTQSLFATDLPVLTPPDPKPFKVRLPLMRK